MIARRDVLCGWCGLAAAILIAATGRAQHIRLGPYSRNELEAARGRYEPFLRGMFFEDLLARLPPTKRAGLGGVQLNIPAEMPAGPGADPAFVLNIGAIPAARQVFLPLRTTVWLDEYFSLYAHLERRQCPDRLAIALLYAGMLARSGQADARPPGPFAAFGLNESIYRDDFVKDVSNKLFKSTLFFLLAHELGHIAHGHAHGALGIHSQVQEQEADSYALDAMANIGLTPLGLAILFTAAAMMESGQTTHPLSGSRAEAAALAVEAQPRSFIDRSERNPDLWVPRLLTLAQEVRRAMPLADDPQARAKVLNTAAGANFTALRGVYDRLCRG